MLQLTQPLYDKLSAIGLDHLILDPWICPARPVITLTGKMRQIRIYNGDQMLTEVHTR